MSFSLHPSPFFLFLLTPPLLSLFFAHPRPTCILTWLLDLPAWKMEIKHLLCRPKLSFAGCFQSLKVEKKNVIKDIRIHVEMGGKIQTVVGCFQSLKVEKKNVIKDIRIHVEMGGKIQTVVERWLS